MRFKETFWKNDAEQSHITAVWPLQAFRVFYQLPIVFKVMNALLKRNPHEENT